MCVCVLCDVHMPRIVILSGDARSRVYDSLNCLRRMVLVESLCVRCAFVRPSVPAERELTHTAYTLYSPIVLICAEHERTCSEFASDCIGNRQAAAQNMCVCVRVCLRVSVR